MTNTLRLKNNSKTFWSTFAQLPASRQPFPVILLLVQPPQLPPSLSLITPEFFRYVTVTLQYATINYPKPLVLFINNFILSFVTIKISLCICSGISSINSSSGFLYFLPLLLFRQLAWAFIPETKTLQSVVIMHTYFTCSLYPPYDYWHVPLKWLPSSLGHQKQPHRHYKIPL